MADVTDADLREVVGELRALANRIVAISNQVLVTEYALEARSIAGAIDGQADRIETAIAKRGDGRQRKVEGGERAHGVGEAGSRREASEG